MNKKPHLLFVAFTLAVIAFLYAVFSEDAEKKNPGLSLSDADSQGSDASKSLKTSGESGTCDSSIQTPHDCSHHHPHDTEASPGGTANPAGTMTPVLFGANGVVSLKDIPNGRFRTDLEALSPESRDNALRKLSEMKVPVQDVASLHADINGFIFYACSTLNRNSSVASPPSPPIANVGPLAAAVNVTNPPLRHSKPESTKVIYLDFNGHTVTNTAWNANFNTTSYSCVPFSLDTNTTTFSDVEQTAIVQIWERVAEHFRPFDVDVTTEEPTASRFSGNNVARALITRSTDSTGKFNPAGATSGGVAYLDVFGKLGFASTFSPAFAYYDQVSSSPANIAEVISHEIGHNMGLTHDGTKRVGNTAGIEYYGGHGSGETSWAPIMGNSYNRTVTQWSKGEYANANNPQDDLDIIARKLNYIADDHGSSTNSATNIPVNGTTFTGIIERNNDLDVFRISTTTNPFTISVKPFLSSTAPKRANLDIMVELLNSFGNRVASINPSASLAADSTNNLSAGVYFLRVSGTGLFTPATGYSSYGCLGSYTVTVKETGATTPTPTPPPITPTPTPISIIGWGRNNEGQCTIPTIADKIQQVAAGFSHSVALRTNGTVVAWGNNNSGQTHVPLNATNITRIAAGAFHSVALRTNGTVVAWGNNSTGQTNVPLIATNITRIAAGAYHSVALRTNGTVIAWGQNIFRQTSVPPGLNGGVKEIAAGHYHTLALRTDGTVIAWGNNSSGQTNVPTGLTNVMMVAGGLGHSIALKADGTVVAWGQNNAGQSSVPSGLTNVKEVSAGAYHSVALKEDGTIVTWGNNSFGQLIRNQKNPVETIGAGHFHTLGSW